MNLTPRLPDANRNVGRGGGLASRYRHDHYRPEPPVTRPAEDPGWAAILRSVPS